MTENKRFTITQDFEEHHRQIRDNGHIIMGCFVESQAEVIVNLLNELHEENEGLKEYNNKLMKQALLFDVQTIPKTMEILEANTKLEEENEQLKQFKEDVFNKIDMHLQMLPTARNNEFNEDDGDPSLYTGAIYMLETLKKELEE